MAGCLLAGQVGSKLGLRILEQLAADVDGDFSRFSGELEPELVAAATLFGLGLSLLGTSELSTCATIR